MKPHKKNTAKVPTKGTRKRWEPLSSLKPVELTPQMTKGHVVVRSQITTVSKSQFLVP